MSNFRQAALFLLSSSITSVVCADANTSGFQVNAYLGGTTTVTSPGNLNLFGETDSLMPNQRQQTDFTWGLGGAYRFLAADLPSKLNLLHDITLGIDYFYFQSNPEGNVWQFQQPTYDNYRYTMPVTSSRFMLDSEWTMNSFGPYISPFIEGGIGMAFNTLSYSDTPMLPDYYGSESVGKHSQQQFAYTVGGGIKVSVPQIKNTILSLRYLYANLGSAATSQAAAIPVSTPVTASLTTQTWVFGLSYLL